MWLIEKAMKLQICAKFAWNKETSYVVGDEGGSEEVEMQWKFEE